MRKLVTTILILAFGMIANQLYAAVDIYMKLVNSSGTQINGEVTAVGYVNWVAVTSTGQSNENTVTFGAGGGSGTGKANTGDFTFQMPLNSASGPLTNLLYTGLRLNSVDIWYVKAGCTSQCAFYKIHLENVFVTSLSEVTDQDGTPTQQVSFTPSQFAWGYYKQSASGSLPSTPTSSFGWNRLTNAPFNYTF